MATISTVDLRTQSPYLYLQAAGSDSSAQSDGSAPGIHLRWDLLRSLGERHLPKGNLTGLAQYATTAGFSRSNDFVKLYRVEYTTKYPATVNFSVAPSGVTETATLCEWRYTGIAPVSSLPSDTCTVRIRFSNIAKYQTVRAIVNPATAPQSFIQQYNDLVEAEVDGNLCFAAEINWTATVADDTLTRIETISVPENINGGEQFISARKRLSSHDFDFLTQETTEFVLQEDTSKIVVTDRTGEADKNRVIAENIRYIRFKVHNGYATQIKLETYRHFITGVNSQAGGWTAVGDFGLTTDDTAVDGRLETTAYPVNNLWPKFKNGAKVNIASYKTRWTSVNGLKSAVDQYLILSKDPANLVASATLDNVPDAGNTMGDQSQFTMSYLDMLRFVALDFHVARMLGLGHIDNNSLNANDATKYIYVASYETNAAIETGATGHIHHTYMTLPTSKKDYRLPDSPVLMPLRYGLYLENDTNEPVLLTDENGYSRLDKSRYINLDILTGDSLLPVGQFFVPDEEFVFDGKTKPVFYGIQYRSKYNSSGAPETNWIKPEISSDADFKDPAGIDEIAPIPARSNPIYTHEERQPGIHQYSVYSVNWFSRPSKDFSNILDTDETKFEEVSTLMPPLNLTAHVIQPEEIRIFTTQGEQDMLSRITQSDKTLVRATFEWNESQNINHWIANEAQFLFRRNLPYEIKGEIKSAADIGNNKIEVRTRSYSSYSSNPPVVVNPVLPGNADRNRFKGSILSSGNNFWIVESVLDSGVAGEGLIFHLKRVREKSLISLDNDMHNTLIQETVLPQQGDRFIVIENLGTGNHWDNTLGKKVQLIRHSNYTETITDTDGTSRTLTIGGITGTATVAAFTSHPVTGVYTVTFATQVLAAHPDSQVEWYKGTVRIDDTSTPAKKKTLEVLEIDRTGAGLKLTVFDPSSGTGNPVKTGSVQVNFHPGYRVYFYAEPGFENSTIYAQPGEGSRQTLLSAVAVDSTKNLVSYPAPPVVLLTREIIEPKKPDTPQGSAYATRPDVYGKSTYTFDTVVDNPYSLIFYRANETAILETLYKPSTILNIQNGLKNLGNDAFFTNRWQELVRVITGTDNKFKSYSDFAFPDPDNDQFVIPESDPDVPAVYPFKPSTYSGGIVPSPGSTVTVPGTGKEFRQVLKEVMETCFLPLTEQPLLFRYIKNGTQTRNKKPVIKDTNGDPLPFSHPDYDQAPMAVKTSGGKLRFTDYTLDGASKNFYFYFVQEMTDTLKFGPGSDILGPVKMVNTMAPPAPQITSVLSSPYDPETGDETYVSLAINPYQESQGVKFVKIYRALNVADAASVRTMKYVKTLTVTDPITDNFNDLDFVPYGETIFYRIVALREIINEKDDVELVPSMPSSIVVTNVVDVSNPVSPVITVEGTPDTAVEPSVISNVKLRWQLVSYNATYYLYKMTPSGNWEQIDKIKSNGPEIVKNIGSLVKKNEDGEQIWHRYKVLVENASGLFNLDEETVAI